MQQTRLNTIFESFNTRLESFFGNPWRWLSLLLMSFLFGFFIGQAVSTTAGQAAQWDVSIAAILLIFTEIISKFCYGIKSNFKNRKNKRSLILEVLNLFKIGLIYSLFLEAFKLGS